MSGGRCLEGDEAVVKNLPGKRLGCGPYFLITFFSGILSNVAGKVHEAFDTPGLAIAVGVVVGVVGVYVGIGRAKDTGSTGAIYVLLIATAIFIGTIAYVQIAGETTFTSWIGIGSLVVLVLLHIGLVFTGGTVGPNQFGEDPRGSRARD
ncbi:hypothetical protein A9995_07620 [Erythrobacter sp. QSSC1-22B]|nr:hypothetical protein A9995_07620 [Erythrobacter sp. QSSC1-22B]